MSFGQSIEVCSLIAALGDKRSLMILWVVIGALLLLCVMAWRLSRALRETNRIRTTLRSIEDLIFVLDREGRYTDFFQSPTMNALLLPPVGFLGKHYRDVLPPDVAEQTRIALDAVASDLGPRQYDYILPLPDGHFVGNAKITPRLDAAGELIGFTSVIREISARKEREDILSRSKAEFRAIVGHAAIPIFVYLGGRTCYANQAAVELTGYCVEELCEMEPWRVIHPEDRAWVRERGERRLAGEAVHPSYELRIQTRGGETRWVHVTNSAIMYEGQTAVLGTAVDISDRRRREQALALSEERSRLALECASDGGWDWDLRTGEVSFSDRWIESLGYKQSDVAPSIEFWKRILHPDDAGPVLRALDAHLAGETALYECENRLRRKSGEYRWSRNRGQVVERDEHGAPLRMIGTDTDITEQVRVNEALREAANELAKKSELLHAIFDASPGLLFVKDTELRTVLCNKLFAGAIGKTPEELYGRTDIENGWDPVLVRGDPTQGIRGYMEDDREALAGNVIRNRFDTAPLGGEIHIFETIKVPLRDSEGRIVAMLGVSSDITEHKRLEEQLRRSEERYRTLVEDSPLFICRYLPSTELTYVNGAYSRFFGKKPEEIIGKPFLTVIPEEDQEWVMDSLKALSADSPVQLLEHRVIAPNGEIRWQRWTDRALLNEAGEVIAYQSIGEDTTERREADKALREAHEALEFRVSERTSEISESYKHLRQEMEQRERAAESTRIAAEVMDHMDEGVVLVSADTRKIIFANPRFEQMFGYDPGELKGKLVIEINADNKKQGKESEAALFHSLVSTGKWSGELENVKKDGARFWSRATVSTFEHSRMGKVWVGVQQDITLRKQAEAALRESEALIRQIADTVEDVCWITDIQEHRVLFASRSYQRVWGRPLDELYADPKNWATAIHPDDYQRTWENFKEAREGRIYDQEYRILRPDGLVRWIHDRGFPIRNESGAVTRIAGIARDITALKRAEEEAHLHRVESAHLARMSLIGRTAIEIAHEVNQPLTGITVFAERSLRRLPDNGASPELREALSNIVAFSMRASNVVKRIRAFAQKGARPKEDFDIAQVIQNAFALIEDEARRHKVIVSVDSEAADCRAFGVSQEIEQVLINLMVNAIEAMKENTNRRRMLMIEQKREGDKILILVKDTGPGIPQDVSGKIFESFFTTKSEGLGLGLAISKAIVEDHGGQLSFRSAGDDTGAAFCIALPKWDKFRHE